MFIYILLLLFISILIFILYINIYMHDDMMRLPM